MEERTALVAGATGLVGNHLADQLINDPLYSKVIIFSRKPLELIHPKIEQHLVDFERLDSVVLSIQPDDVFCALGTTIKKAGSQAAFRKVDYEYVVNLANFSSAVGAKRLLVVSAMGADAKSRIFYNRVKGEMEGSLSQIALPEIHIFRPSLILGKRNVLRFGEYIAQKIMGSIAFLFAGPLLKYRAIHASAIARAMIIAARAGKSGISVYPSDVMQKMHN
jgi:uncharacterized protein YbjT (DUF2867 family)